MATFPNWSLYNSNILLQLESSSSPCFTCHERRQHIQRVSVKVIHDDENHGQVLHIFFRNETQIGLDGSAHWFLWQFQLWRALRLWDFFDEKLQIFVFFTLQTWQRWRNLLLAGKHCISTKGEEIEFDYQSIDFGLKLTFPFQLLRKSQKSELSHSSKVFVLCYENEQ